MISSKWTIIPPLKKREICKLELAGLLSLTFGVLIHPLDFKAIGIVFILAGAFFMIASPLLFRETTIRGNCPNCGHIMAAVLKEHIICPFCKQKIETNTFTDKS